jgi:hypothetical protein
VHTSAATLRAQSSSGLTEHGGVLAHEQHLGNPWDYRQCRELVQGDT